MCAKLWQKERAALFRDMRFGRESSGNVPDTGVAQRYKQLGKEINRLRQVLRREGWTKVKTAYHRTMEVWEIDEQIDQTLGRDSSRDSSDGDEDKDVDEWIPPPPTFWCKEQERIADAFFGPDAETLIGAVALGRRIQVIKDLVNSREEVASRGSGSEQSER